MDSSGSGSFEDEGEYNSEEDFFEDEGVGEEEDDGSFEYSDEEETPQIANLVASYLSQAPPAPQMNYFPQLDVVSAPQMNYFPQLDLVSAPQMPLAPQMNVSQMPLAPQMNYFPQLDLSQASPAPQILQQGSIELSQAPVTGAIESFFPGTMERKNRRFYIHVNPDILQGLRNYDQYFVASKGRQEVDGWSFPPSQEAAVRGVLYRIFTGQLPPPNQLPQPSIEQMRIDTTVVPQIPIQQQVAPVQIAQSMLPPQMVVAEPAPRRRRQPAAQVQTTSAPLPSAVVMASMPTEGINIYPSASGATPAPQAPLPSYEPTAPEAGESQEVYQRRLFGYQHLLSQGYSSSSADVISRMRNDVDVLGVGYHPTAMASMNQSLPQ